LIINARLLLNWEIESMMGTLYSAPKNIRETAIVITRLWLKKIEVITYITKGAPFFSGSPLLRIP